MQNLKKELEIMNKGKVPYIFDKDIEAVVKVIKTRYLSIGPRVVQFKKKVNEYIGINSISEITSTA